MADHELFIELSQAGHPVQSVSELGDSGKRYTDAIPILLTWLSRLHDLSAKEELVRALSVPWARKTALDPMISEFRAVPVRGNPQQELYRWAVGNAIETLWDDARFDDLIGLARDSQYGKAREMVVLGIGKSKRQEAVEVLITLLDDPVVNGHATSALRKLAHPDAAEGLARMLQDDRAWVRKEAARALEKLS